MEASRDKKFMLVGISIFLLVILSNFLDGSHHGVPPAHPPATAPVVYLDPGTGCEYLLLPGAAVTPRMDAGGRQRCIALPPPAGQGKIPTPPAPQPKRP